MNKTKKIFHVEVAGKEWLDRINGNSYCAVRIVVTFDDKSQQTTLIPMRYGYGDYYLQVAAEKMAELGMIAGDCHLWQAAKDQNFVLSKHIEKGCRKAEVNTFGKGE